MIEYAALAGNAAQRYIMIVSQLYAKGSLQYAREPFMRREYGKSKNRKRICNLSCFPESLLHLSLYPYKTRLHQKARFAFPPISRFVLILTDNYCSARCLYLA